MRRSTRNIPGEVPQFERIAEASGIDLATLRDMYVIWKNFDTTNLGQIMYY
jgi:hypothetical protein